MAELVECGQTVSQAEIAVKAAFGVPGPVDLLNTNPISGTQGGDATVGGVLEAVVQVQNLIVQASSVVMGASALHKHKRLPTNRLHLRFPKMIFRQTKRRGHCRY